ncbi:putative radial spoke head 10-like B [Apostichopus japonicus]|uniref:Putative radial spoke head 10-like B n=1 Tax=Stichopus japonicus TaxID=307972 RepID=A0A2G8L927_STIJA|nr:putative radial spoke head 10-like B [Apostichopus japonicus]
MHGRGTYTWSDGVVYEGDFTNNEITGKGLYHWPDSSTYEGEVLNGKRHGHGTFRCMASPASYTGQWKMGQRHGTGIIRYDTDGLSFYEGDWMSNKRHGYGVRRYRSGNVYEGEWANNNRHGQGIMRWVDLNQTYNGQWEKGVQNGHGDHTWYIRRLPGSQYPMRNQYIGDFLYGRRHGYGVILYANGSKYEGDWLDDKKSGRGIFTFKNGRIFEGIFVEDRMADYPEFVMDGTVTPDISEIRTRTPDPAGPNAGNLTSRSDDSHNTLGPSLTLDIDHLLNQCTDSEKEDELQQVMFVVLRHVTVLKKTYNFYSSLGHDASPDNTFIMTKLQFWRMLKDCRFHFLDTTLAEIDRILAVDKGATEIHSPLDKLLMREYLNHLITLSYHLYLEDCQESEQSTIAWCFDHAIRENIIPYGCDVQGNFLYEPTRAINALGYMDKCWQVYKSICTPSKFPPHDHTLKMRDFLFMLKDYRLINERLTSRRILEVLSADDPAAYDSETCNLELEMTFLDFFESLIGCAMIFVTEEVVKDPNTPRPSTVASHTQTTFSTTSRATTSRGSQKSLPNWLFDSNLGYFCDILISRTLRVKILAVKALLPLTTVASLREGHPGVTMDPCQQSKKESLGDAPAAAKQEGTESGVHESLQGDDSHIVDGKNEKSETDTEAKAASIHSGSGSNQGGVDGGQQPLTQEPHLLQSMLSMGGEEAPIAEVSGEEEMDEATRDFNFWTHQINIFFIKKLFPAYEHMQDVLALGAKIQLEKQLAEADKMEKMKMKSGSAVSSVVKKIGETHDGPLDQEWNTEGSAGVKVEDSRSEVSLTKGR